MLIVRSSLEGQVRVFATAIVRAGACSAVLIALYSGSLELFGVGVALVVVKGIMIPRVLNRAVAKIGLAASRRAVSGHARRAHYLRHAHDPVVLRDGSHRRLESVADGRCDPARVRGHSDRFLYHGESPPRADADSWISDAGERHLLTRALGDLRRAVHRRDGGFSRRLVAVLIMEVFVYRIKENFDSIDVGRNGKIKRMMLISLLLIPLAAAGLIALARRRALMELLHALAALATLGTGAAIVAQVWNGAVLTALGDLFRVDALSAFMVAIITFLGAIASLYAVGYIRAEYDGEHLARARLFFASFNSLFSPCCWR